MKTKGDKKQDGKPVEAIADGGEESDDVYIIENDDADCVGTLQPDVRMLESMFGFVPTSNMYYPNYEADTSPVTGSNTESVIDLTDAVDDTADIVIVDEVGKPSGSTYGGNKRMSAFHVHQALRATETQEPHGKRRNKVNKRSRSRSRGRDEFNEADEDIDNETNQHSSDINRKKKRRPENKYIKDYFVSDSDSKKAAQSSFVSQADDVEEDRSHSQKGQTKGKKTERRKSSIDEVAIISTTDTVDLSGSPASQEDRDAISRPVADKSTDLAATKSSRSGDINAFLSAMAGYSKVSGVQDIHTGDTADSLRISPPRETEGEQQLPSTEELIVVQSLVPKAITTSTGVIVLMQHPSEFAFKGRVTVQPLIGQVAILGYNLEPNGAKHDIFSPNSNSLLTITTKHGETDIDKSWKTILDHDSTVEKSEDFIRRILQNFKDFVILKFEKLNSVMCDLVTSLTPYRRLFETTQGSKFNEFTSPVGVTLHSDGIAPSVTVSHELRRILDNWTNGLLDKTTASPAIMVCGCKDSGKSTTNRLLMNASLNRVEEVYYLECDVGQTEFTPPGCVSLHRVTQPIFGPPFCHQMQPIISYNVGGLSPQDDPDLYLQSVRKCHRYYTQLATTAPLVVNTMGWLSGLGLQLLIDTIHLVCPSHLVQLMSRTTHQNVQPISEEFLQQDSWSDLTTNEALRAPDGQQRTLEREYQLFIVDSPLMGIVSFPSRLRPNDHRNLSLLSHLGSDLEPGVTLLSTLPYTVPFESVAVHVCHRGVPSSQVLCSINAGVVALCKADLSRAEKVSDDLPLLFQKAPVCQWLGYGVVRGIDMEHKVLYIVTSLPYKMLRGVNTLLKGTVTLPEQILMAQTCGKLRPYVDDTVQSVGSGAVKPRRYMPRKGSRPRPDPRE